MLQLFNFLLLFGVMKNEDFTRLDDAFLRIIDPQADYCSGTVVVFSSKLTCSTVVSPFSFAQCSLCAADEVTPENIALVERIKILSADILSWVHDRWISARVNGLIGAFKRIVIGANLFLSLSL